MTFASGSAARLQFQQQPSNTQAGATITPAVTVRSVDGNGNTVTSFNGQVTLTLGANPGAGTLSGTVTQTAVSGVATFNNLSIDKAAAGYTLVAESGGLAGATSSAFSITPGPPSAANSTITAAPTTIPADGTSTSTITVQLTDQFGNDLTSGGAAVTLSTTGGSLSAVTDRGDGTYTATLRSSTASATVNVTGTVNGQAIADNEIVTFTAGSAQSLGILVQPSNTPVNQVIAPPISVRVVDAGGNTVTSFSGNISVVLSSSPSGGTLSGTTTVQAVSGVATFSNLRINRAGNGYVLTFSSTGINSVASTAFSITAGAGSAATTTITADPVVIAANGAGTSTITVQVKDAAGNDVTAGGAQVQLSTTAGTLGPVTDRNNGTYTAILTSAAPGTATISGTLSGAPIVDNATVTFAAGTADLEVTVIVSDETPDLGETIIYMVTVRNRGPDAASGIQVTDDLPDRLTFLAADASQGSYDSASGIWSVGGLANGATATLEITVRVN
ncbi:MAG: DUF11 domain-containing protein [Gemmatimonadetes bacterium]|nr:DUF11 domain-containing protein [Gemmatimonadota bacterium]